MKSVNTAFWIKSAVVLLAAVMLMGWWVWNLNVEYDENLENYRTFESQTQEYLSLKERWAYDPASEEVGVLKTHPRLIRQEKTRGGYLFEFGPLSASEFDELSNKILNAPFTIKKLNLRRNPDGKGEISVEFEG